MKPFNHINAKSVNEAVKLLQNSQGKARLISGGTDLLGSLKDKILPEYPETIINIKTIPRLDYIKEDAKGLKIGALTTLEDIARSPEVKDRYSLLADAAESVAAPQIRHVGTIGGNLCQDVRCWYYRYPDHIGGQISCYLKGGRSCYALTRENRYHSIFGGIRGTKGSCSSACPGGIDIRSYLSRIREGRLDEAAGTLLNFNPLPSITGRVCPHFCEQACNRGEFDEPVSVRDIERFIGDYILENADRIISGPETDSGKRVAVIGSGPAGLSAAYYLRMSGHSITVFESSAKPGGMMRDCIPDFRLPKDILDAEIKMILDIGVDLKTNTDILSIDSLFQKGYDAVFLAQGAHSCTRMGIRGEGLPNVMDGISFLKTVNLGGHVHLGDKVAVIGGGNTAVDSARTALRLGAREVSIVYRRTKDEMPAGAYEIDGALEEGVKTIFLAAPSNIEEKDGRLILTCTRMEPGKPDDSGRRQPVPVKGSEFSMDVDSIVVAIGQTPDIPGGFGLSAGKGKALPVSDTQATDRQGVWAGGDVTTGSATVIEAIASGKRAAFAMNLYLGGPEAKTKDNNRKSIAPLATFNNNCLTKTSRSEPPKIPVGQRRIDLEDISGLSLYEAEEQAKRCFNCSCVSVNASDIGVALTALDAKVKISGSKGVRTIPIGEFFGSLRNSLAPDEMVTEIQIPRPPNGARQMFIKYRLREAVDFAIVSIASVISLKGGSCKDARISLGAVAPRPIRAVAAEQALKGRPITSDTIEAAAQASVAGAIPLGQNAYKIEIIKTLVKRALAS